MAEQATLTQLMSALQDIGHAVSNDSPRAYRRAVEHARAIGVTELQIRDAYDHRSALRVQAGKDLPSFNAEGEPTR